MDSLSKHCELLFLLVLMILAALLTLTRIHPATRLLRSLPLSFGKVKLHGFAQLQSHGWHSDGPTVLVGPFCIRILSRSPMLLRPLRLKAGKSPSLNDPS